MDSRKGVILFSAVAVVLLTGGLIGGVAAMDLSGDGLTVAEDVYYGTDPMSQDTAGNGLTDHDEIHVYGTDPLVNDTTGDGLSDYDEIHKYGTDPTTTDTTGDGLSDYDELNVHGTDPTTADTTGDGLSDYNEIHEYGTDPTTTHTTENGLSDYTEIHKYGTDPLQYDTSGDGLYDGLVAGDRDQSDIYGTVDPLQKTVAVEITYMEGTQNALTDEVKNEMIETFANAPVENVDGSTGINLVFVETPQNPPNTAQVTADSYFRQNSYDNYHTTKEYGTRHLMVVGDYSYRGNGNVVGSAIVNGNQMIVQDTGEFDTGLTATHELGHSLGISHDDHVGIDSWEYSVDQYPSVMNYNYGTCDNLIHSCWDIPVGYQFSDGSNGYTDHDDWGVIERNIHNGVDESELIYN